MSTEPEPGLAPEHAKPRYAKDHPIMVTVDGQDFRIVSVLKSLASTTSTGSAGRTTTASGSAELTAPQ